MAPFSFHTLPVFTDKRGSLTPIELKEYVLWDPKRVYYAFDISDGRGGHAHRIENEFFVCLQGKMTVKLHDGKTWTTRDLTTRGDAVRVDNMVWHEFTNFSENAILLAISSTNYDSDDYIRNFDHFIKEIRS